MAFNFLHNLMDVPVQHSDGTEALEKVQRFFAILRSPPRVVKILQLTGTKGDGPTAPKRLVENVTP